MTFSPLCYAPWTSVFISDSQYNCCCFYSLRQEHAPFPSSAEEMLNIVNSRGFQDLRQRLLSGDIKGTACETCLQRSLQTKGEDDPDSRATPAQRDALCRAMESARRGEVVISHLPVHYGLHTCTDCNLRCVMCYNSKLPEQNFTGSLVPYKKFISMVDDIGLENITGITVGGGETFMTKDALAIITHLAENQHTGIRLCANTNGTLLHRHYDLLEKFKNLYLEFSIEGFGESYERIRRGASWERMIRNLEWCVEQTQKKPGWTLSVNSLIMKTSLPHMAQVIELAKGKVSRMRFTPVMGDYFDENIFQFPDLLAGLDWRAHFDEAEAAAATAFPEVVKQLRAARRQLERALVRGKDSGEVYIGSPELFTFMLRHLEEHCPGSRVALVGTRNCLTDFLAWAGSRTSKKLVIASFEMRDTSRSYAGLPVVAMEHLAREADSVLLCCQTFEYRAYRDSLAETHPELPVTILPYWDEEIYAAIEAVAQKLAQNPAGTPVVFYGAGGTAEVLLDSTPLGNVNVAAFSDGNHSKWGGTFLGRPVVPPSEIPSLAKDVVICSDKYSHRIAQDLDELHGDALRVHRIF
ncbi:MAG: radical SAM protein [Desulfovibrio sp.]